MVWNQVLDWRGRRYLVDGLATGYAETDRFLTELKKRPELAFLNEVSSVPLQQRYQSRAFNNFFAHRGSLPTF